jgi:nucleoside-diphosphate-sugar epimerase
MGDELTYYSDGEYIRDYLHVDDVVEALMSVINNRSEVSGETFVIGSGIGTRVRDALAEISKQAEQITGVPVKVSPASPPADMFEIERRDAVVDSSRFRRRTGWQPKIPLAEGIKKTFSQVTRPR